MFVNRTSFLITSAIKLNFMVIKHIPRWKLDQIGKILNKVVRFICTGRFCDKFDSDGHIIQ